MNNSRPNRKTNVRARKLGNEWLLYDQGKETLHILNPTAEFVWRLCDGRHDFAAIKAEMREKYDISDEQRLEEDLNGILREFARIDILQRS